MKHLRSWAVGLAAISVFVTGVAFAASPPPAAPPALNAVDADRVADLLGRGSVEQPGGCRVAAATATGDALLIRYECQRAPGTLIVRLAPKMSPLPALAQTKHFSVLASPGGEPPKDFLEGVVRRLSEREGAWTWTLPAAAGVAPATAPSAIATPAEGGGSAGLVGGNLANVPPPPPSKPNAAYRAPAILADYDKGLELYRAGKTKEALAIYLELAKRHPGGGVLGMVVATLAPTVHDTRRVKELVAEADARPGDLLAQFVAGVAAHYSAHQAASSREEKKTLYTQAIRYLEKVRPAYDFEPRVYIYLAVSHFRLGHQKEAEALIESGVKLSDTDPDAYYCRAEIFQRTNLPRSLKDLEAYLSMTAMHKKQGAVVQPQKEERVRKMYQHLVDVASGKAKPAEIFDPMATEDVLAVNRKDGDPRATAHTSSDGTAEPPPNPSSTGFAVVVLGVASGTLAVLWLVLVVRRRRGRTAPPPPAV